MKISYTWLQTYFEKPLPTAQDLVERMTFGFAEVESVEKVGDDTVFDIKVLPDRACYALCHHGVASEVAAILNIKMKPEQKIALAENPVAPFELKITEPNICLTFVSRKIENVNVSASPAWLKARLEAIGQRSINNVVDATNYVMFDIGRPLHAFDADKVEGTLVVRFAKKGETITTLDNKHISLDETILIIADDKGPLALAGIKGGKRAEVNETTKNLILEAANWDPIYIRKASTKIGIRTDGSKRFENRLSPFLGPEGVDVCTKIIVDTSGKDISVGKKSTITSENWQPTAIMISVAQINSQLGAALSEKEMLEILSRLALPTKKEGEMLLIDVPPGRLDLTVPEDIVEEIGRIYSYEKIKGVLPPKLAAPAKPEKTFYYTEKIKNILAELGFNEVCLYTFVPKGDVEVAKPLASDKSHLRTRLTDGLLNCLELNARNADYLGLDTIKIFEIGNIFTKTGEYTSLAIGLKQVKKKKGEKIEDEMKRVEGAITQALGVTISLTINNSVAEINFTDLVAKLPEASSYADLNFKPLPDIKFEPISAYPYIVRDIALFVPATTTPEEVTKVLVEEKTNLLVKGPVLFDDFTNKENKRSLAFRMIYQSFERTLSDAEVNTIMEKIYEKVKGREWEVR